jgi:hypothetical protein
VAREVLAVAEGHWFSWINIKQLLHVEDLDAMAYGLAPNDHEIILATDFAPRAWGGVLGQASKVRQLALLGNFGKGSSILLADGDKFTAIVRSPTPRG